MWSLKKDKRDLEKVKPATDYGLCGSWGQDVNSLQDASATLINPTITNQATTPILSSGRLCPFLVLDLLCFRGQAP